MKVELLLIADDSKRIKDFSSLSYLIAVDSDVELTERSNKKYKFKYRRSSEIEIKMSKNKNILNENVFHLEIEGSYEALGSFRGLLLSIVKPYFDEIYIISDEVSMEMCRKAYPLINEIENLDVV